MAWEIAWDSNRKRWYYQDRFQGTSSWERPADCTLELPRDPPPEAPQASGAADLPPGWQCSWDVQHRRWYYYNHNTEERLWERPPASPSAAAASAPGPRPGPGAGPGPAPEATRVASVRPDVPAASTGTASTTSGVPANVVSPRPTASDRSSASGLSGTSSAPLGGTLQRRQPRKDVPWDAEDFINRLAVARATGSRHATKAVLKEVAEHNYKLRTNWAVPRTQFITHAQCMSTRVPGQGKEPEITFSTMTTADALYHYAFHGRRRACGLNFANGVDVGGGYKNGAQAQEEDLCRRMPNLYTSLFQAKRDGLYPFGPGTAKSATEPGKYCDVLWTPNCVIARAGDERGFTMLPPEAQASVSLVAAAAPNLRFANPPDLHDKSLMYNAVKSILIAPRMMEPEVTTIVLGAWGCGAFGGNAREVCELFCRALVEERLGRLYEEVHFAIPAFGTDENSREFKDCLHKSGIPFREITPSVT